MDDNWILLEDDPVRVVAERVAAKLEATGWTIPNRFCAKNRLISAGNGDVVRDEDGQPVCHSFAEINAYCESLGRWVQAQVFDGVLWAHEGFHRKRFKRYNPRRFSASFVAGEPESTEDDTLARLNKPDGPYKLKLSDKLSEKSEITTVKYGPYTLGAVQFHGGWWIVRPSGKRYFRAVPRFDTKESAVNELLGQWPAIVPSSTRLPE